jgi:hypothetical protein
MADVQASRLIEMMRGVPVSKTLEVCLPPMRIKASLPNKFKRGDTLLLPLRRLEVLVIDEDGSEVAQGRYGVQGEKPALWITECKRRALDDGAGKKHSSLKVVLGRLEENALAQATVVPFIKSTREDAILVVDERTVASASLVRHDHRIALKIEEVWGWQKKY